ncbi:MAG: ABC transporter substrate-binding protein [Rubellimicrobium sp.]|nr:ABC transporter substrate-binding protein [Rubellimicrobium sp.]
MTVRRLLKATTLSLALALGAGPVFAEGVLRIGRESDSKTLDPIRTAENLDIWIANNLNATLVRSNREATDIEPDLAESWTISDDGLTYVFTLREALFSDGSPVTADDVVFSLLRVRDDPASAWASNYANIADVEATDDRTVTVTLTEPSAPFLATLSMVMAAIVPEAIAGPMGEDFGSEPVGAGAFRLKEWRRGEVLILEANPHYYEEGLPILDTVEWRAVTEDNTRILQVQGGQLDAALFVPFNRIAELEATPGINVHLDPSTRTDHIIFNHENEILANPLVRQAIAHATDREAIVQVVTFGHGTVANSYIPGGAQFYNPDNPARTFDLDGARALMEEAGVGGIALDLMIQSGDEVEAQIAVLLQQQWQEIGVDLSITRVDPSQWFDILMEGDFDMSTVYWTNDMIDADQKVSFGFVGDAMMNFLTRYENPDLSALVLEARSSTDPERRQEIYYEVQRVAEEDAVLLNLYYSPFRNISRDGIEGFYQNPLGRIYLETVSVE